MSGGDPFDPFGQNDRTIVRPNPGGRQPAPTPQPGGQMPPSAQAGSFAPPPAAAPSGPLVTPGTNPLIIAAGPLLDLLGRLRNSLTQASFADLKGSVSKSIEQFESVAMTNGAKQNHLFPAKYAICTMADDVVMNLPGENRQIWSGDPMLPRYCDNARDGGVGFFRNLDKAMQDPGGFYDLLELKYVCLSLGFEGMHRAEGPGTGAAALQQTRREIYNALRRVEESSNWAISPNWEGNPIGKKSVGMQIPFWAVSAVVALVLTGSFFGLRFALAGETGHIVERSVDIHPEAKIEIARTQVVAPPPPPPPPPPDQNGQLDRIRSALAPEIQQGLISAEYLDQNFIIVRMSNKLLFPSGKAEVSDDFTAQLAPRIGEVFNAENELLRQRGFKHGRVISLGHSDAQPLSSTSRWASNQELSKARASSVMETIAEYSPPDLRTLVEGRGPDDPICVPADDTACWPENRRVELLIERTL